jgi:hypothetical protein
MRRVSHPMPLLINLVLISCVFMAVLWPPIGWCPLDVENVMAFFRLLVGFTVARSENVGPDWIRG